MNFLENNSIPRNLKNRLYPTQLTYLTSSLRIATPFIKEQTAASAWLLSRDTSLYVFNKLPQVGELLGDKVDDTANERIMAIVGGFTTIKGNYLYYKTYTIPTTFFHTDKHIKEPTFL